MSDNASGYQAVSWTPVSATQTLVHFSTKQVARSLARKADERKAIDASVEHKQLNCLERLSDLEDN